ncbi:class I SAM-dependent methyltransferase [Coxiella-like endosymbiont of Rhipicephalus sanguineus]|uniref:class I SAM-dependent methyltransferase n=1 Tax=Coxiella-like endosymbiont of Rhipicephalus sanguineus TaxID=1955402 RepID=UPI00203DC304|nr:class I SAM-dependent methyltransferase [Coxiella-like endosymbiont of Rhipicephalus sanguineus]
MNSEFSNMHGSSLEIMRDWYQHPPGSLILSCENEEATRFLKTIRGKYLIQIGGETTLTHSAGSPILYHIQLTSEPTDNLLSIQMDWQELPLLSDSIDVFVLVHVLEFINYPVKLIQEIFRVLKPEGRLFIFGFNPWSLWGLEKLFFIKRGVPWNGKFWACEQVKRWLINFKYSISFSKTFYYGFLPENRSNRRLHLIKEIIGKVCFPTAGGIYLLAAKKEVYAPVHRRILWKKESVIAQNVIKPTPSLKL